MIEPTVVERGVLARTSRWVATRPRSIAHGVRRRYHDVDEREVDGALRRLEERGWIARRGGWVRRTRLGEHVAARVAR